MRQPPPAGQRASRHPVAAASNYRSHLPRETYLWRSVKYRVSLATVFYNEREIALVIFALSHERDACTRLSAVGADVLRASYEYERRWSTVVYGPSNRHVYSRHALNVRISRTRCAQFAIPVDECGWQMRIIIACEYKARIGTRF